MPVLSCHARVVFRAPCDAILRPVADVGYIKHDMDARCSPGDREIAALAHRQHGVIARRQLVRLGFGRGAIQHRIQAGRLHRLHTGVYAVGHTLVSGHGDWIAAVLACGPEALLSHRSAAALWGFLPDARRGVDVTAPCRSRRNRREIVVHRARRLDPADRDVEDGIPVTTVARTLLDIAGVVPRRHLERAVEAAERLRLFDLRSVDAVVARGQGRRGLRALSDVLRAYRPIPGATRSELERRFLELCRAAGLPPPALNALVAGLDVDVVWHPRRLVVELDGRTFHDTQEAFERDRVRDATLALAGYRVLRVTYRRLTSEPHAVMDTMQTLLGVN